MEGLGFGREWSRGASARLSNDFFILRLTVSTVHVQVVFNTHDASGTNLIAIRLRLEFLHLQDDSVPNASARL